MSRIPSDFPWRAGMKATASVGFDVRIWASETDDEYAIAHTEQGDEWPIQVGWTPDPTDPATLGALLGAVREAWSRPDLYVRQTSDGLRWLPDCSGCPQSLLGVRGDTEFDALLAAWAARPRSTE